MNATSLQALGLNAAESAIYLFLLQRGPNSGPQLQTALEMQKVPVYRALASLRAKGFVTAHGETRNQQFAALPAQTLLQKCDEQASQVARARSDIEALVRQLTDQQNDLYKQNKIQLYEGTPGYRLWNEERLQGDTTVIREVGINDFLEEFFADTQDIQPYMEAYIKRRVGKGIAMRCMADTTSPLYDYDHTIPELLKEVRVVDMPDDLPAFLSIFGSRLGFYTRAYNRYLGVIIDDPMLARLLTLLFDALWDKGKQI